MGSFFSNLLVENTSPLDMVKQNLTKALKPMGFVPAEGEGGEHRIRVFGSPEDRFLVLVCDAFQTEFDQLLIRFAKAMKCRVIAAQCVDSDVLLLSLTKGGTVNTVYMGQPEAYEIEPAPLKPAPWKALVGAENWAVFLQAVEEEHVFAEEALEPLSRLIGFSSDDAMRVLELPGEPLLECAYQRKEMIPYFLPEGLPPRFKAYTAAMGNPVFVFFVSEGGAGTGIEVLIAANDFNASDCRLETMGLQWGNPETGEWQWAVQKAKFVAFQDGRKGWTALFTDVPIFPGPNPEDPERQTKKGIHRFYSCVISLRFLIAGGGFPKTDPNDMYQDWRGELQGPTVDIYAIPIQNREGLCVRRHRVTEPDMEIYEREYRRHLEIRTEE